MPSRLGARKAAAAKLGLSVEAYLNRLADGDRWCADCRSWHPREMMARDGGRPGGRAGRCRYKGRLGDENR